MGCVFIFRITKKKIYLILGGLYMWTLFSLTPAFFQIKMDGKHCVSQFYLTGNFGVKFFMGYAVYAFVAYYTIPCALFFCLYGKYENKISPNLFPTVSWNEKKNMTSQSFKPEL